jgi:hypothetical protein
LDQRSAGEDVERPANFLDAGLAFALSGNIDSSHANLVRCAETEATVDWQVKNEGLLSARLKSRSTRLVAAVNEKEACWLALRLSD